MMRDRYLRHRQIPGFDQARLQSLRIAVVGAGAIGNEVVKNLCLLGVGHVDVYDFDRVELHNLTRSVLLREADIGSSKAEALVRHARALDPAVQLRAIEGDLWKTFSFDALARVDAVIAALDNFEARLRLNQLCHLAGKPWLNAAIDSRHVSVERFMPDAACYECNLPESVYARLAQRQSCGGLMRMALKQQVMPTTAITASIAGAQTVNQLMRLVFGQHGASGAATDEGASKAAGVADEARATRWLFDTHTGTATNAALPKSADCPCCSQRPARARIESVVHGRIEHGRIGASVQAHPSGRELATQSRTLSDEADPWIELSDRIIDRCHCLNCGATDATRALEGRRAAEVPDAILRCGQCGEDTVQVDIRDGFDASELEAAERSDRAVDARFAQVDACIIDLEPETHATTPRPPPEEPHDE